MHKLIPLTALLLGLGTQSLQAQQKSPQLGWKQEYRETDTLRSFTIMEDQDHWIQQLVKTLKAPLDHPNPGQYSWQEISIPGLGTALRLELKDGIMEHDRKAASSCWKLFTSEQDKVSRMQSLNEDRRRVTEITITDSKGQNILNTTAKEALAKKHLLTLMQS
ncbi:hypothetical protein D3C72_662190 [compost metagenome]